MFIPFGLEFVVKGQNDITSAIRSVGGQLGQLGQQIDDIGKKLNSLNDSFSGVGKTKGSKALFGTQLSELNKEFATLGPAVNAQSGLFNQLANSMGMTSEATERSANATERQSRSWILMVAAGVLVRDTIRAVIDTIGDMIKGGVEAIGVFQRLNIGMTSLLTRELVTNGRDYAESLALAVPKAAALMDELMRFSIMTPYTMEATIQIMRQAQAYGFTADQAIIFAKSLTNVAAATGVGNEVMARMAYNLAQIRLVGKVTQRDIRDLGNASFDLMGFLRYLGKEFNVVVNDLEDFNNAIAGGTLTWDQFITGFAKYSGRMGDATAALGRTVMGVFDRLKNIIEIFSINVMEPAANAIAGRIADIEDSFLGLYKSGYLQAFGQLMGETTNTILSELATWAGSFNINFGQMAYDALKWGIEIVSQFATGMVEGANTVLSTAMNAISAMLSFWLAPGSPPRVAPDIEKWGLKAIAAWLHGFTLADFSVLESLQRPLQSVLEILGKSDIYVGISASITQAISEITTMGTTAIDIVGQLMGIGTQYGTELAALASKQLALAAANKAVTDSQKKIEESDQKITDLTVEYNRLRRSGASKAEIRAKALEIEAARKARLEAVKTNDEAKKKVDTLKDQIKLQEQILEQLIAIAKAMEKATTAVPGEKKGKDEDMIPSPLGMSNFTDVLNKTLDKARKEIDDFLFKLFQPLRDAVGRIIPIWNTLGIQWNMLWLKIQKVWEQYGKPIADQLIKLIPAGLIDNLGWAAGAIAALGIVMGIAGVAGGILAGVLGLITSPIALIIVTLALLKTAWDNDFMGIQTNLTEWWTKEGQYILIGLGVELGKIKDRLVSFFQDPRAAFEQFRKDWDVFWTNLGTAVFNKVNEISADIRKWFVDMLDAFVKGAIKLYASWQNMLEAIKMALGNKLIDFIKGGADIVGGLAKGIGDNVWLVLNAIGTAIGDLIQKVKDALGIASPSSIFYDFGKALVDGLVNGFKWAVENMTNIGAMLIGAIWNAIKERLAGLFNPGSPTTPPTDIPPIEPGPYVPDYPTPPGPKPPPKPQYQYGGIFSRPTAGLFGEAGPEAVIPLNRPYRALQILASAMSQRYALGRQLAPTTVMASAQAGPQRSYNLYMTTTTPPHNVAQDFAMLRAIGV